MEWHQEAYYWARFSWGFQQSSSKEKDDGIWWWQWVQKTVITSCIQKVSIINELFFPFECSKCFTCCYVCFAVFVTRRKMYSWWWKNDLLFYRTWKFIYHSTIMHKNCFFLYCRVPIIQKQSLLKNVNPSHISSLLDTPATQNSLYW